jgi:hypothetical protein
MTGRPSRVVAGVIAKRRELTGIIAELERQLAQHRADLTHIDGVLRVLASDFDPETIKPKRIYRRSRYFAYNELSRLCLAALRTAEGKPLSIDDLAIQVMTAKGFNLADAILRASIRDRIGPIIKRLHRQGIVAIVGAGRWAKWRRADDQFDSPNP